ncbi:MAG: hypothetical protein ACP5I8_13135 [Phycisphaerae bacterium]
MTDVPAKLVDFTAHYRTANQRVLLEHPLQYAFAIFNKVISIVDYIKVSGTATHAINLSRKSNGINGI